MQLCATFCADPRWTSDAAKINSRKLHVTCKIDAPAFMLFEQCAFLLGVNEPTESNEFSGTCRRLGS